MSLAHWLFRLARLSADERAIQRSLEKGSIKPLERRAANRAKGKLLGRAGVWRRLWR